MQVSLERDAAHERIFDDEDVAAVVEAAAVNRKLMHFLGNIVQRYDSADAVRLGRRGGGPNLESYANQFLGRGTDRKTAQPLIRLIEKLYGQHDPGNLRGTLIEAMVQRRLRVRYGSGLLDNNVYVILTNQIDYRTSTSIDVVGHDGDVGECHDCKARARRVDAALITELVQNLGPHGFRFGIATADSTRVAVAELRQKGIDLEQVRILAPERWWDGLPLWPS